MPATSRASPTNGTIATAGRTVRNAADTTDGAVRNATTADGAAGNAANDGGAAGNAANDGGTVRHAATADGAVRHATGDGGMVTVEAAVALCSVLAVFALLLAGMSTVLDQLRCTDAAREAARLVARGEPDRAADAVRRIAPQGATFTVTTSGDGIVVAVRDRAPNSLLPGVHVDADAYAVPEPDADASTVDAGPAPATGPPSTSPPEQGSRSTEGGER
jgi:hypothetical protein